MTAEDIYVGMVCIIKHKNHPRTAIVLFMQSGLSKCIELELRGRNTIFSIRASPLNIDTLNKDPYV